MKKISILLFIVLAIFAVNFSFAAEPDMEVQVSDITQGETAHVSVNLPSDAEGKVVVSVNGQSYSANVVDGKASVDLTGLDAGDYQITVEYEGRGNYSQITKTVSLKVNDNVSPDNQVNASGDSDENSNESQINYEPASGDNSSTNNTDVTNHSNVTKKLNDTVVKQPSKKLPPKPPKTNLSKNPTGIPIMLLVVVLIGVVFGAGFRRN